MATSFSLSDLTKGSPKSQKQQEAPDAPLEALASHGAAAKLSASLPPRPTQENQIIPLSQARDLAPLPEEKVERSASEIFSKLIVSINSISKTSGEMKNLLAFETKNLLSLKREQLKKRLSSMVALAELYVTAMVMAPITFIIMITLLSVLGGSTMSLSPVLQLNLIVFFGIPVICVVFILILDSALPKED